jgi:phosphatidylglycerophosphatase B
MTVLKHKNKGLALLVVLLVLIAPMVIFTPSSDLLSPVTDTTGLFFTLLTDSAGSKGFLITLAVLCAFMLHLKLPADQLLTKLFQLGVILVIGFASKTGLKHMTESPRPYTELIAQQLIIPEPAHFYRLDDKQREQVIDRISDNVSEWRTKHWQGEKDYSFPSGHTIFVAICIAFFGGLFLQHKRYVLTAGLLIWALGVAYSRLWLGMHRPIDLIGSILFIFVVYALLPSFSVVGTKLLEKLPERVRHSL